MCDYTYSSLHVLELRNEGIRKKISKEVTIIDTIKKRKLGLVGHICRMVLTQWTRPTGMKKSDPVNCWPQRGLSLWDMMMMMI
jgi:hypothetical protein